MVGIGLLAVFARHHYLFEVWEALFKVQEQYGHGLHNPLKSLFLKIEFCCLLSVLVNLALRISGQASLQCLARRFGVTLSVWYCSTTMMCRR